MLWERESSASCFVSSPYSKVYSISTLFEPLRPRMWFTIKSYYKIFQLFYTLVTLGVIFNPIMVYICLFNFHKIRMFMQNVQVHFISAVCENMISGKGMHPGDIVTASNGITIEVYSSFLVIHPSLWNFIFLLLGPTCFILFSKNSLLLRSWIFQVLCLCCVHR